MFVLDNNVIHINMEFTFILTFKLGTEKNQVVSYIVVYLYH